MSLLVPIALLAANTYVLAQSTAARRGPQFPGALTQAPPWLKPPAPFDVAKLLDAPPRDQNGAFLYLDALFEFSNDVAICFPPGPDRDRRAQVAEDRGKRYAQFSNTYETKLESAPAAEIDTVLADYEIGFKKLAQAQRRERCVFQTGIGFTSPLPHAQAARQVARISLLRVQRAVDRNDFAAAIHNVDSVLRLTRDLQPRGTMITQLVVIAMNQLMLHAAVPRILASPALNAQQCDELLKVLTTHEAKMIDGIEEGSKMEYLMFRALVRDVTSRRAELAKELKVPPGTPLAASIFKQTGLEMKLDPRELDARIAKATPAEIAQGVEKLNTYYRLVSALKGKPYLEQVTLIPDPAIVFQGDDPLSQFLLTMSGVSTVQISTFARTKAMLRGTECLVAVRRWQLGKKAVPANLEVIVRDAKMKGVPIDPYDGKPFRMAIIDGQAVIYSVGKDGKDDGGRVDSDRELKPGDILFRLPALNTKH